MRISQAQAARAQRQGMAADPYWLDEYMNQRGPYVWHRSVGDPESVLSKGLLPWDHPDNPEGKTNRNPHLTPRSNHVYLMGNGGLKPRPDLYRVDLRKLNPENLNPDEDAFLDDHPFDLPSIPQWGPGEEWASRGDWANANNVSQPSQTAWSLEAEGFAPGTGTIAHRGPIPPEAIDYPHRDQKPFERDMMLGKASAMTLPQEQRQWENMRHRQEQSPVVHQFPDGWTVKQHQDEDAVNIVGAMMHNCWQSKSQPNEGYYNNAHHALHDEHDIPRVAFYWQRIPGTQEDDPARALHSPLAARNGQPEPEHLSHLWEFAQQHSSDPRWFDSHGNYVPLTEPDLWAMGGRFGELMGHNPQELDPDHLAKTSVYHEAMPADPSFWEDYVRSNPYLYHGTDEYAANQIREQGLKPWDQTGDRHNFYEGEEPDWFGVRPGHTYLTPDEDVAKVRAEHAAQERGGFRPVILKVRTDALDPQHVNPDEDDWPNSNMFLREMGEIPHPYNTLGEAAEGFGWGDKPEDTHKAIGPQGGNVAYRGVIPPHAVEPHMAINDFPKGDSWGPYQSKTSAQQVMYHVAPSAHHDKIMSEGLKPFDPGLEGTGQPKAVYLFDNPEAAHWWVCPHAHPDDPVATEDDHNWQDCESFRDWNIYEVNAQGHQLQEDPWTIQARYTTQPIEPQRIKRFGKVTKESDWLMSNWSMSGESAPPPPQFSPHPPHTRMSEWSLTSEYPGNPGQQGITDTALGSPIQSMSPLSPKHQERCEQCGSPLSDHTCLHCSSTNEECGWCGSLVNDSGYCEQCGSRNRDSERVVRPLRNSFSDITIGDGTQEADSEYIRHRGPRGIRTAEGSLDWVDNDEILQEVAKRTGSEFTPDEISSGQGTFRFPEGEVWVELYPAFGAIQLDNIEANPKGTGIGTQVVNALIEIAKERGLPIKLFDVKNPDFFDRFDYPWKMAGVSSDVSKGTRVSSGEGSLSGSPSDGTDDWGFLKEAGVEYDPDHDLHKGTIEENGSLHVWPVRWNRADWRPTHMEKGHLGKDFVIDNGETHYEPPDDGDEFWNQPLSEGERLAIVRATGARFPRQSNSRVSSDGFESDWGGDNERYQDKWQDPEEKPIYVEVPFRNTFSGENDTYRGPVMKIIPFNKRGEDFHRLVINPMSTINVRPDGYKVIDTSDLHEAPEVPSDRPEHYSAQEDSPSHKLWWKPGVAGRGFILRDGSVHTWPEDEGTHQETAYQLNEDPVFNFHIRPDGMVARAYMQQAPDDNVINALQQADRNLQVNPNLKLDWKGFVESSDTQPPQIDPEHSLYIISVSMGGYMPESEPYAVEGLREAKEALWAELERAAEMSGGACEFCGGSGEDSEKGTEMESKTYPYCAQCEGSGEADPAQQLQQVQEEMGEIGPYGGSVEFNGYNYEIQPMPKDLPLEDAAAYEEEARGPMDTVPQHWGDPLENQFNMPSGLQWGDPKNSRTAAPWDSPDPHLDRMLQGYTDAALWSTPDYGDEHMHENNPPMLDENYGPDDIHPDTMTEMRGDVSDFIKHNWDDLDTFNGRLEFSPEAAGHDLWLTREGHGAGFWDRYYGDDQELKGAVNRLTQNANAMGEYGSNLNDGIMRNELERVSPSAENTVPPSWQRDPLQQQFEMPSGLQWNDPRNSKTADWVPDALPPLGDRCKFCGATEGLMNHYKNPELTACPGCQPCPEHGWSGPWYSRPCHCGKPEIPQDWNRDPLAEQFDRPSGLNWSDPRNSKVAAAPWFCPSYHIPDDARDQIHQWAQTLPWPEGSELKDPSQYHITSFYSPSGYENPANHEWLNSQTPPPFPVQSRSIEEFNPGYQGKRPFVLTFNAPELSAHAENLMSQGEARGIPVQRHEGHTPHITLGFTPPDQGLPPVQPPPFGFQTSGFGDLHSFYDQQKRSAHTESVWRQNPEPSSASTVARSSTPEGRSPIASSAQRQSRTADMEGDWKTSDYQGWQNWESWNTALMMDNDQGLHNMSRELVAQGASPEQIKDWAVKEILGPYNRDRIDEARDWNETPEWERPKDMWGEAEDDSPELIDPEDVNWEEIHQSLLGELQEQQEYDRKMQENPPPTPREQYAHLPPNENPYHWGPGDVLEDRGGARSHVQQAINPNSDYLPMKHIAPTEYYHGDDYSLHPRALVDNYGYKRVGNEPLDKNWLADPSLDQPGNLTFPQEWT